MQFEDVKNKTDLRIEDNFGEKHVLESDNSLGRINAVIALKSFVKV